MKLGRRQFAARQISKQNGIERGRYLNVRASNDNGSGEKVDQKPVLAPP